MPIVRLHLRHALLSAAVLILTVAASADANGLRALKPGEFVVHQQTVPIDLVFIGYDEHQIDEQAILEVLPADLSARSSALPAVLRSVGSEPRAGLSLPLPVRVARARSSRTSSLRTSSARECPALRRYFRSMYNEQVNNVLDVTGPVLYIDAPKVERYLAGPHGDDQRGYTIFFINWFGRQDFQLPRLHQDRRARSRHRVQLRRAAAVAPDHRLGRHLVADLVLRPVRRPGGVDEQLDRRRRPEPSTTCRRFGIPRGRRIARRRNSARTSASSRALSASTCCLRPRRSTIRSSPRPMSAGPRSRT